MKNTILLMSVVSSAFLCITVNAEAPFTPESILPEGVDSTISTNPYTGESGLARKGTVAATLNNVARLNHLLKQEETPELRQEIIEISSAINTLIPSLQAIGMFNFFEPDFWISRGEQPGKVIVICLYFKHYPEKYTAELREKLGNVRSETSSCYLREQIDAL